MRELFFLACGRLAQVGARVGKLRPLAQQQDQNHE
jgi:hypothetical protein